MIVVKCDKCKKEVDDLKRIYNVSFIEREAAEATTDERVLYSVDAGLYAATKRNLTFHICSQCFNHYISEVQEGVGDLR